MGISHFLKVSKTLSVVKIPELLHQFYAHTVYPKHGISTTRYLYLYDLHSDNHPYSQITTLSKWPEELNSSATPNMWSRAFRLTYTTSHCSNHWE